MKNTFQQQNKIAQPYKQNNPLHHDDPSLSKKNLSLYSLKPQHLSIPKDVSTINIFQSLIKDVNSTFTDNPKIIELTHILIKSRLNIITKFKRFIAKYRLSPKTLFLAVYIMDTLIARKTNLSLDKIGLGAIILAVKFIDIDGTAPTMNQFKEVSENIRLSIKEMILIEIECIKKLDYILSFPTPLSFIQIFLVNGIVFNTDMQNVNSISSNIYQLPCQILDGIMEESAVYYQYKPFYLACACVALSREIYGLNVWSIVFEKVFGLTFDMFQNVFNFVKE